MGAMCEICENRKDLELYIHIPFCIKKCNYCDFLSFPSSAEDREEYVRCLVKEIEQTGIVLNNKDTYQVRSVFIGGRHPISSFRRSDKEYYAGGSEIFSHKRGSRDYNGGESGNSYKEKSFCI